MQGRGLAGLKAYITNIDNPSPEFVIGAYHQPWRIEKSFRMSKHDLRARPIYHHKRDSIQARLAVVFAALAVTRLIEDRTGWSIKKFRPHRPPLPHGTDPRRPTDPHGRGAPPSRPTRRARSNPLKPSCALIWPKSGCRTAQSGCGWPRNDFTERGTWCRSSP